MYLPPQFEEVREREILKIIENFPLAVIVCDNDGDLIANHIPLFRHNQNSYLGHIAKANQLHNIFPNGVDALAIFSSENSYVSPNWYPTKAETHRHVPTWNYQAVHMKGRLSFDYSNKSKLRVVGSLTKLYERLHSGDEGWKMSDAPKDFMGQMLDSIVAFQFDVESVIAKSKLSQNRELKDFNSVKRNMQAKNKKHLFDAMDGIEKEL
jgi:transcriptional regulator